MFWASSDKRSDSYTSHSESATTDDGEPWPRSMRTEKRSKKGKRKTKSTKNTTWLGALVGSTRPSNRRKTPKKNKRSKTNNQSCNPILQHGWGKILMATLFCVYLLNFLNVLYSERPGEAPSKPSATGQSNRAPVTVTDVTASSLTNQTQSLAQTSVRQTEEKTDNNDHLQLVGNPSESSSSKPGNQTPSNSATTSSAMANISPTNSSLTARSSALVNQEAPLDQYPAETEKHPMNRNMFGLQVPGNTGVLPVEAVKAYYRNLSKAYLSTFTGGIHRQMYFDILRRRTYSLTPPRANKGIQTILFQIIDGKVYMMDPYEVPRNSKPFYRTRINQVIWLLSKLCHEGRIKNTEFLMAIHDCVQTVNKPHTYRGAHFSESNPAFTIVSCNFSDNVPFPMWEGTKHRDGGFQGWDETMKSYALDDIPWEQKQDRAVFRGGNRPSMYFLNKTDADIHCNEVGRTRLQYLSEQQPDLFDVSVGGTCGGKHSVLRRMKAKDHHKFKYILYAEGNCMWADRSKQQVFGPSAIIKQETPCGQFFEPLLKPDSHYIPTDFFFTDTVEKIKWARQNDEMVHQIVKNANEFARNFLSLQGVELYVEVLLEEYTALLVEPDIKLENGAIEVTDKEV